MFEPQDAVLLRKVATPLLDLANYAGGGDCADFRQPHNQELALLRIPDLFFARLRYDHPRSFILNLGDLYFNLNRAGDDDELTIHGNDDEDLIGIVTVNSRTREFGFFEMSLAQAYPDEMDLPVRL